MQSSEPEPSTDPLLLAWQALQVLERECSLTLSLLRAAHRQGKAWVRCHRYSEPWIRALTAYARTRREADAQLVELQECVRVLAPLVDRLAEHEPAEWWPPQSMPEPDP